MSMKTKAAVLVSSFAVLLFVVVGSLGGVHASSNDGSYRQMQVYSEVLSRVQNEYVEDPNIPKVTDGALHGLVESLDANSSYMTPEAYKAYKAHKSEAKGEIGATVSKRFGYADVVSVLPGSPAEKAGIETTDISNRLKARARETCRCRRFATPGGNAGLDCECFGGACPPSGAAENDDTHGTWWAFRRSRTRCWKMVSAT